MAISNNPIAEDMAAASSTAEVAADGKRDSSERLSPMRDSVEHNRLQNCVHERMKSDMIHKVRLDIYYTTGVAVA